MPVGIQRLVLLIIHRIISFFAQMQRRRIFLGHVSNRLLAKLKILVLNDAGIRNFPHRVIHHPQALMILFFQTLRLKTQTPIFQLAQLVVKIRINGTGINNFLS